MSFIKGQRRYYTLTSCFFSIPLALNYPNCAYCPPKLSIDKKGVDYSCKNCGAIRMQLWDVPSEKLLVSICDVIMRALYLSLMHLRIIASGSRCECQRFHESTPAQLHLRQ